MFADEKLVLIRCLMCDKINKAPLYIISELLPEHFVTVKINLCLQLKFDYNSRLSAFCSIVQKKQPQKHITVSFYSFALFSGETCSSSLCEFYVVLSLFFSSILIKNTSANKSYYRMTTKLCSQQLKQLQGFDTFFWSNFLLFRIQSSQSFSACLCSLHVKMDGWTKKKSTFKHCCQDNRMEIKIIIIIIIILLTVFSLLHLSRPAIGNV